MENFSEFDQSGSAPQKEAGNIISHAWENYKGVIGYGILYFFIAFIISFLISLLFPGSSLSPENIKDIIEGAKSGDSSVFKDIIEMNKDRNLGDSAISILTSLVSGALLYPLHAGLLYISHKVNTKQNIDVSDLFIGYKQNTVNIMIYGLIISILASIGTMLCLLPGIYVYIAGFVGLPILFFGNKNFSEGLSLSFNTTNQNFGLVLGTAILAFLISIAGVLLCGIGIIFSAAFLYSASYSLYCALFGTPYEIKNS